MTPETVTTKQLLSSFTPKHWTYTIATICTVISSVFVGGLWLGNNFTESQSKVMQAEMRGVLTQTQAKLDIALNNLDLQKNAFTQLQSTNQKAQENINHQQQLITSLSTQLGRANNCEFVHMQIKSTQIEIDSNKGFVLYEANQEFKQKEREKNLALQRRLEIYQQQLSTCNK